MICLPLQAADLYVAVASNFKLTMQQIVHRFEESDGVSVKISSGATGKHYAQIRQGAPFDVFFAADSRRPRLLQQQGLAKLRFTYALGRLLLWSPQPDLVDNKAEILSAERFQYLAMANPKLAPYGRAAQQVLQKLGRWKALQSRIVRGENVGQALQYVKTGNAQLGFVAAAQVMRRQQRVSGSWWWVPTAYYDEIRQQAVALNDKPLTRAFMRFVRSTEIQQLIGESGYLGGQQDF